MRQLFGSIMPRRAPSSGRVASLRGQIDPGPDSIRTGRRRYPLARTLRHPDGDRHALANRPVPATNTTSKVVWPTAATSWTVADI
jgi:hypothetical protein